LIACRLGARRVIAVEPAAAIHVAREVAAANGYGNRIECIQGLSSALTLPTRADVIVSDMRGVLPFHRQHLPSIADARSRLLAPGGALIPRQDTVWGAPAEATDAYGQFVTPWADGACGLNLQPAHIFAVNTWIKTRLTPGQLLAPPQPWVTVNYTTIDRAGAQGEMRFTVTRSGTMHGVGAWFDADLGGDVGFSNAPGEPELIYGHAFFPITAPVVVHAGDIIVCDLRADLVGEEYVWRWSTRVFSKESPDQPKASYTQSTFWGEPLAAASLRKRAASFIPRTTAEADVDRLILSMMDGHTPLGDIARTVMATFASRFPTWEDALARVGRLSVEYSE
jgi:protein arginine N-methyltransferase 1